MKCVGRSSVWQVQSTAFSGTAVAGGGVHASTRVHQILLLCSSRGIHEQSKAMAEELGGRDPRGWRRRAATLGPAPKNGGERAVAMEQQDRGDIRGAVGLHGTGRGVHQHIGACYKHTGDDARSIVLLEHSSNIS